MNTTTTSRHRWPTHLALCLALAGCALPAAYREGQEMIDQGRYEEGLGKLASAASEAPDNPQLRSALITQQSRVVAALLANADKARQSGDYSLAEDNYRRVIAIEPRNSRALEALRVFAQRRNLVDMQNQGLAAFRRGDLELAEKQVSSVLALEPRHEGALSLRKDIESQRAKAGSPYPQLRSKFARPVSLEFRDASLKMILDVLARTTGINFILDREVKNDLKATIFVRQVPVEDALELLLAQSQLEKKVINDNTVVVYPSSPAKLKEYQDWAIRTFFITNMDVKQAQNLIKTILKTKDTVIDEKQNILTMRDTPEAIRLAEKLLLAQDQPDPEVVLEVELLDVSRNRFLDLGIQWPTSLTLLSPTGAAAALLSDLTLSRDPGRYAVDSSIKAKAQSKDSDINTLASPRIRVRNKEKAKIHIGDRIPIVNATSVPSTQGPVITETVQYLDTGIKLEVEPVIYQNDEVSIKIGLEVSDASTGGTTKSGTSLVNVKTSNAATVLRLKDGETQVLAGLIRNDNISNLDGIAGLAKAPVAGRLFGKHDDTWNKRELVLAITPRIVRNTPYVAPHTLEFASGTEGMLRARPLSLQAGVGEAVALSAPAGPAAATTVRSGPVVAPTPGAAPAAGNNAGLSLSLDGKGELKVGQDSILKLNVKANQPLVSSALQIGYDPKAVKVMEVIEGGLMKRDGTQTTFSTRMDENAGRVFVGLSRSGNGGITGEGELLQLRVQGVAPSAASALRVVVFSGMGPGNALLSPALPAPLSLSVVP
ncbi:MAG: secretin and TonB N-terminal domain-containing protein [Dechloromonas sp.]|nr:secretin and TonB N-terminal domain-containing protein [Dechloromonas sp.]